MLHLLLAAVVLATPAPPDPCKAAHHVICGRIRVIPADSNERRAFIANIIATAVDGIVTTVGTHGNPALEADPIVRPFIRGGLPMLTLGWGLMEVGQRSVARSFHLSQSRADIFAADEHIAGAASWLSPQTYAWTLDEPVAQHMPYVESLWVRCDLTPGCH